MTALKYWDGSAWVTVPAIQGPTGPAGPTGGTSYYEQAADPGAVMNGSLWVDTDEAPLTMPGTIIDVQKLNGTNAAYVAITSGSRFKVSAGADLALSYTPPVNCWWDVDLVVGTLQKTDAAYHYAQIYIGLTPTDEDGIAAVNTTKTQHSTVQTFEPQVISSLFKLKANTAYQVWASMSTSGGTWQYWQGSTQLWIQAKAIAR